MKTTVTQLKYHKLSSDLLTGEFVCLYSETNQWSYLGLNPLITITHHSSDNPHKHLEAIDQFLEYLHKIHPETKNSPFHFGLLGFLSYDFGNQLFGINKTPTQDTPLSYWQLPQTIYIWDHQEKTLQKIDHKFSSVEITELKKWHQEIAEITPAKAKPINKTAYNQKIHQVKEYLRQGESYQINFAHEIQQEKNLDPIQTFNKIRQINPSPYQALIKTSKFSIISNSPELLIERQGDQLTSKPIKGTIPQQTIKKQQAISNLKADPKTIAELTMIVDMSRNDLGQISKAGTIKVKKHQQIQELSHVIHTYSTVIGQAKENLKTSEIIQALFPGASVTGCPKKRTMELIAELENSSRGVYCGSAGFLNHNGDLSLNIMIRTLWQKNNRVSLHSGGGIVIDSQAESEYDETLAKAAAFLNCLSS